MKRFQNQLRPPFEVNYLFFVSLLTFIYTFPLIIHFREAFYGFPGDSLGGIWYLWWQKFSYLEGISLRNHTYLAYPTGNDLSYTPFPYISNILGFILTFLSNEVIAFNILKLISFPLLSLTTYYLIYYLTEDRWSSALIGLVYAFSPFHTIHNMAHFANMYWIPLALLGLLRLLDNGGYKKSIIFGTLLGMTSVENVYYGYFMWLLAPIIFTFYLFNPEKRKLLGGIGFIKVLPVGAAAFAVVVLPMILPVIMGLLSSEGRQSLNQQGLVRNLSDLLVFSARPLDYLIPSKYNPVLGSIFPDFGISAWRGHRYTEHTLYLGYSLVFLGGYAFFCSLRKRSIMSREDRWRVYVFSSIALVGVVLSGPPFIPIGDYQINLQTKEVIAEHKIYLPQYFLYKILPMFRVYARMGALVLLAACIVAAFGLREILGAIRKSSVRTLFIGMLFIVFIVEYLEYPPFRITPVNKPKVYQWLATQPGRFPIVEYPLGVSDDPYTTYEYSFYQRIHHKFLVNGAIANTDADRFRKEIIDISSADTVKKLKEVGVKYILIHRNKYENGNEYIPMQWITDPPREKLFPEEYNDGVVPDLSGINLRRVNDFGDVVVYELADEL